MYFGASKHERLRETARKRAESLLLQLNQEIRDDLDWLSDEDLRHLDAELASALVTALFAALFRTKDQSQLRFHLSPYLSGLFPADDPSLTRRYSIGNRIVALVSSLGDSFEPDIRALCEIYCDSYSEISPARTLWNKIKNRDVIVYSSHLAISWQLAWTISRAGLSDALVELRACQSMADQQERSAVADLIEDMARYSTVDHHQLLFGGGDGPPELDASELVLEVKSYEYEEVNVFYGTDRQKAGTTNYTRLRSNPAELHLGTCVVSIPRTHKKGKVERPTIWTFSFEEDPNKHVVLQEVQEQTKHEFIRSLRDKSRDGQVLVYIHGYNVTFEAAARQAAQLAYDLDEKLSIVPVFFSWPSRGKYLAYLADLASVQYSKPHLKDFLEMIANHSGAKTVHVIAHSMGSEALRFALEGIRSCVEKPAFRDIVLAAPDIDADVFKNQIAPWLKTKAVKTTLYCSRTDKALWSSKLFRLINAAGYDPIVLDGIDTIDASGTGTSFMKHSYYSDSIPMLSDLYYLFLSGLGPDQRKGPKRIKGPGGFYWVLRST